jgi:hypothetical protein
MSVGVLHSKRIMRESVALTTYEERVKFLYSFGLEPGEVYIILLGLAKRTRTLL